LPRGVGASTVIGVHNTMGVVGGVGGLAVCSGLSVQLPPYQDRCTDSLISNPHSRDIATGNCRSRAYYTEDHDPTNIVLNTPDSCHHSLQGENPRAYSGNGSRCEDNNQLPQSAACLQLMPQEALTGGNSQNSVCSETGERQLSQNCAQAADMDRAACSTSYIDVYTSTDQNNGKKNLSKAPSKLNFSNNNSNKFLKNKPFKSKPAECAPPRSAQKKMHKSPRGACSKVGNSDNVSFKEYGFIDKPVTDNASELQQSNLTHVEHVDSASNSATCADSDLLTE